MTKTLKDFLLEGGVEGKTFLDRTFFGGNKPYRVIALETEDKQILLSFRYYKEEDFFGNDIRTDKILGEILYSDYLFTHLNDSVIEETISQTLPKYTEEPLNQLDPYNRCPRGQSLGD